MLTREDQLRERDARRKMNVYGLVAVYGTILGTFIATAAAII